MIVAPNESARPEASDAASAMNALFFTFVSFWRAIISLDRADNQEW
jgi:hypothetical protein